MENQEKQNKILTLIKNDEDADIISSRLHSVVKILEECEEDDLLDMVQTKVTEAIDWYALYCNENGYEIEKYGPTL